jgi:hypothetical protein
MWLCADRLRSDGFGPQIPGKHYCGFHSSRSREDNRLRIAFLSVTTVTLPGRSAYVRCRTEINSSARYARSSGPAPVVSLALRAAPHLRTSILPWSCAAPCNVLINTGEWSDRMKSSNFKGQSPVSLQCLFTSGANWYRDGASACAASLSFSSAEWLAVTR